MARHQDKCPDCGKPVLIGTAESIAPHLTQANYAGITEVVIHELPLCERQKEAAEEVAARIDERIAQAKKRADEKAKRIAQIEADAQASKDTLDD